jgi:hypothetical protein
MAIEPSADALVNWEKRPAAPFSAVTRMRVTFVAGQAESQEIVCDFLGCPIRRDFAARPAESRKSDRLLGT